jgi:REP element-mobilizing transposase RayT
MEMPVRKSPRLKGYDYSLSGVYSLTICTHHRQHLLGKVVFNHKGNSFEFSDVGLIIQKTLEELSNSFPEFETVKYSIMPNHLHLLVAKVDSDANQVRTVSDFVCALKSLATKEIHLTHPGMKIWKESFHDHIIRNESDFSRHWDYIDQNVNNWQKDEFFQKKEESSPQLSAYLDQLPTEGASPLRTAGL